MADDSQAAVEEKDGAKAQPEQPAAPKEEQPKARKRDSNIAELQRVKDREVAEANKRAKEAQEAIAAREAELAQMREMLKHANLTGDEEARLKALIERERRIQEREERTYQTERAVTIRLLTQQYGVPAEELEAYDDPVHMELAALKWERVHAPRAAQPDEDDEPEPEPKAAPTKQRFDLGSGAGTSKSFKDMTSKELADWERTQKARVMQQMRGGR